VIRVIGQGDNTSTSAKEKEISKFLVQVEIELCKAALTDLVLTLILAQSGESTPDTNHSADIGRHHT